MSNTPDFKILYDGSWWHDGAPIRRDALAKLFSDRALMIDDNCAYWLRTPYEQYPVEVEDVPYVIRSYDYEGDVLVLHTNMDESVRVTADQPLFLRDDPRQNMKLPYIEVRDGLLARLGRNVYYQLAEEYGAQVQSAGQYYPLGEGAE